MEASQVKDVEENWGFYYMYSNNKRMRDMHEQTVWNNNELDIESVKRWTENYTDEDKKRVIKIILDMKIPEQLRGLVERLKYKRQYTTQESWAIIKIEYERWLRKKHRAKKILDGKRKIAYAKKLHNRAYELWKQGKAKSILEAYKIAKGELTC